MNLTSSKPYDFLRNDLGLVVTFLVAGLIMIWLSYGLPRFLPGDFVTATYGASQVTLTAEQEKFRVGTSTTLQVAQAWRDVLASQINEVQAVINQRKALIELYRLEGTLLERRGIDALGRGGAVP